MKTKTQISNRILSLVLALVLVLGLLPTTVWAAGDYTYMDADGNQKSVSAATTVLSDTTAWSSGWYYVDSDVTISSRITVSGDVKLILGAGCTLIASQGIHVSGGNALTVYSQETAGTFIAIGTEYSAAIGGNGKNGAGGEDVDTSVGTIEINGGNITATGGRYGAAIGGGWGGKNGNITINRGSVTATGGDYGAGIGTSQMATDTVNITITGGTVNATGGLGAASIGIGYGAEESNGAVIHITGGNITAARNWAAASIGNGVGANSATTISITGGVIDAEVIGNYNGGWTAVVKDICGAGFKQNPSDLLDSTQYTELKDGLYYVYWKKASAVISTSVSGSPSVWVDGIATSHTGTRYQNGKLYIYGIPAGNVKATLNGTDYYGVLANTSAETELKPGYVKATGITLNLGSITAGAPIDLANYVVFQPQSVTFQHKITAEVVMESTTSVCTLNGSVLTASAGKVTVKITASDGYSSCSGTFSFDVAESDNLDIAYGNIEIAQKSDGNYDVSYPGFTGGKKTYGATEAIVITGTTEEYSVKVLSGTPTVVLNNCNITTWFTDDSTASPFAISSGATAYLMLQGESTLRITSTTNTGEVAAIAVPGGAALYINGTGILNVIGKHSAGAIGGKYDELLGDITINGGTVNADYYARNEYDVYYGTTISGSNITINGGTVTAKAGMYGTAIGSGYNSKHATTVTINGGVVNASAVMDGYAEGVAIGNAYDSQANCSVTINGGTVTALSNCAGAAIGSARIHNANVSTSVTINGGTVTATSDLDGAGIGGGESGSGVAVTINGGTVTATGNYGAGIGGGYNGNGGTVTITGGNIKATATNSNAIGAGKNASEECVVSDGKGNSVSLNAITLEGAIANTAVSAIKGVTYDLKDVKTLDTDKLYFYLPSGTVATTITAGSIEYICKDSNLTYYASHDWSKNDGICARCGKTCEHENQTGKTCEICGMTLHTHRWEYETDGTTITASCTADGCTNTNGGSVTIVAPTELTYHGTAKEASYTGALATGDAIHIVYASTTDELVGEKPVHAGDYTASITIGEVTASVKFTIEKATVTVTADEKSKTYGDADPELTYTANGLFGEDKLTGALTRAEGEYAGKYAITQGTLTAGDNYTISFTGAELTIVDETAPTGEILIKNNGWKQFWNWISFGLFCKDNVDVTVTADGTGSGVAKVEYLLSGTVLEENNIPVDGWTTLNADNGSYRFSMQPQSKVAVYVRITDEAGNETVINSDGIVVYEDSKAVDTEVHTTYRSTQDVTVKVELNGNTIEDVKFGTQSFITDGYCTVNGDTITLDGSKLYSLDARSYEITVYYNPMGVEDSGVTDLTTTFTLVIDKADGEVSNINISGKAYDGTAVTAPTYDKLGNGVVTVEYKVKGADDSTYTTTAPKNAGDYVVRVTAAEGTNHKAASATAEFGITTASIENAGVTLDPNTVVYNGSEHKPAVTVTWNGITLTENTDYVVDYRNNVNASDATVLGIVSVVGTNNFEGSIENEFEIIRREITITVEAKETIVNTTLPAYTYKVDGLIGEDMLLTEPTITCNANIAVVGEYEITAIGADAGGNYSIKYVPAKLTVLTDNAVDAAAGYTEELKDYDPATVTSEDKAELEEMLSEIETILDDENITDNGKKALEEVKEKVEKLIKEINDAAEATDTENTVKVENVTPENVTPENKTDLENAKADLEKALADNGGNYTEDEKKAIEDEIKRIDDALEVIGKVEVVEDTVSKLPAVDTVKPDDEEAIKAITDAQTAYNALSDYEKSLVDEATKANLDKLAAALVAYDIVEGDGSSWTEDSTDNITFVVNGLLSKFVGIQVDGKDVDKANYEAKAGSTIITLKASYLDTLAVGEHTITAVYTDGSADGTFHVHAKANSPATEDNSYMFLWIALFFLIGGAVITLIVVDRKRRMASKR